MCRQIDWLFHWATVRDIDFSKWYDNVSMIVDYDEYLGDDLPGYGIVQLKFINVHLFTFQKNTTIEERMLSPHIRKFSKELDRKTGKRFYCLALAENSILENKIVEGYRLEIHFDDAEVKFLSHFLGSGCGFLSPKEREQLLRNQ